MRPQDNARAYSSARYNELEAIEIDYDHVTACWPVGALNAPTHVIAKWCGWTVSETLARLERLRSAMVIEGEIAGPDHKGEPIVFWRQPHGARGLPMIEDKRLRGLGIYRATKDARLVTYQGEPELVVRRRAREQGLSLAGIRLIHHGPAPEAGRQLPLAGVCLG